MGAKRPSLGWGINETRVLFPIAFLLQVLLNLVMRFTLVEIYTCYVHFQFFQEFAAEGPGREDYSAARPNSTADGNVCGMTLNTRLCCRLCAYK